MAIQWLAPRSRMRLWIASGRRLRNDGAVGQSSDFGMAMQPGKILLAAVVLALQTPLAQAKNVTRKVGGVEINFAIPREFCVLDAHNLRDYLIISFQSSLLQEENNKLVLMMLDCDRLKTWREGVNGIIPKYAVYYTPRSSERSSLSGEARSLRRSLCQDRREHGDPTLDKSKEIVARKAEEMGANFALDNISDIGVVDEDEHGCYAAILSNVTDNEGNSYFMSTVELSTVIQSKRLSFEILNRYDGPETTLESVERSKVVAAELDRANP